MKVLVTGATGFLGSHVVPALVRRGTDVVATGRDATKLRNAPWSGEVECVPMDMGAPPDDPFAALGSPTHCVHLAWPGLPDYASDVHLRESLPRSLELLGRLMDSGLKHVLVAGTCFEYGLQEGELAEDAQPKPATAYGRAKDELRRSLERRISGSDVRLQWTRLFYMHGAGQNPRSLFAQLERAIGDGQEEFPMSGGEQVRDYLPVEEVAEILVSLALHPTFSGIVNVCSGRNVLLRELVREYADRAQSPIKLKLGVYPYPEWEPFRFWGSTEKLDRLGVTP